MRLTPEQVRERFELQIDGYDLEYVSIDSDARQMVIQRQPQDRADADWAKRGRVIEFALRLAADLQAPPTGEEVELAKGRLDRAIEEWSKAQEQSAMPHDCGPDSALDVAVRAYGAACAAQARAEADKAADVLRRLEDCLRPFARPMIIMSEGDVCVHINEGKPGHGPTLLDAIAAALDQLAAETGRR